MHEQCQRAALHLDALRPLLKSVSHLASLSTKADKRAWIKSCADDMYARIENGDTSHVWALVKKFAGKQRPIARASLVIKDGDKPLTTDAEISALWARVFQKEFGGSGLAARR